MHAPLFFAHGVKALSFRSILDAIILLFPMPPAIALALLFFNFNPRDSIMSDHPNPKPDPKLPPGTERRVEPFLDCLAFLLAKRWLREQRQSEEKPSQDQPEK